MKINKLKEVEQAGLLDLAPKFFLYMNSCANYQNNNSKNGQSKGVFTKYVLMKLVFLLYLGRWLFRSRDIAKYFIFWPKLKPLFQLEFWPDSSLAHCF